MPASPTPSDDERLNGWKEIAAFFNRSVRAVQRWERELKLPVRRITTERGATVYALRSELQDWLSRMEQGVAWESGFATPSASPRSDHPLRLMPPMGLALGIVLGVALVGVFLSRGEEKIPVVKAVHLSGQYVQALGVDGTPLWEHDIGFEARLHDADGRRPVPLMVDLDGDGAEEVLVAVRAGADQDAMARSDTLFCFSADGRLLWSYSLPEIANSFRGTRFPGPTRFLAWTPDDSGGVWIAINHHTWWPTVLVRVDAQGRAEVKYVQSGGIYALTFWRAEGDKGYLVAGGIDNERRLASVAVLDADGPPAVSPQSPGSDFYCDGCAQGAPEAYILFPRSEVGRLYLRYPYSIVDSLARVGNDIRVAILEEAEHFSALYHLISPDLTVKTLAPSDSYVEAHERLQQNGQLDHRFEQCADRERLKDVVIWRPSSGWRPSAMPPV